MKTEEPLIYKPGEYIAIHLAPVWRQQSNFILNAHLGIKESTNEWEQLWGRKVGAQRFIICCIPFFVRGVALGDEVETSKDFVLTHVVVPSGQVTFRVWFGADKNEARARIIHEIGQIEPAIEWSSENFLALSAPEGVEAKRIAEYLYMLEQQGLLQYETGR